MNETKNNKFYQVTDGDRILLTIEKIENNIYRAKNSDTDITCEVVVLDEYRTSVKCLEHKRKDKNGHFRKSTKLLDHHCKWLLYMLENKGFITTRKPLN